MSSTARTSRPVSVFVLAIRLTTVSKLVNRRSVRGRTFSASLPSFELRNNLFVSTDNVAVRSPRPPVDLDYSGYWRLGTSAFFPGLARIDDTSYDDMESLYVAEGIEEHGVSVEPRFVDELVDNSYTDIVDFDYSLRSDSGLIDRGLLLPGINDDYAGEAPDIGAFEYGR